MASQTADPLSSNRPIPNTILCLTSSSLFLFSTSQVACRSIAWLVNVAVMPMVGLSDSYYFSNTAAIRAEWRGQCSFIRTANIAGSNRLDLRIESRFDNSNGTGRSASDRTRKYIRHDQRDKSTLFFVSPGQINIQVPWSIQWVYFDYSQASVVVTTLAGSVLRYRCPYSRAARRCSRRTAAGVGKRRG